MLLFPSICDDVSESEHSFAYRIVLGNALAADAGSVRVACFCVLQMKASSVSMKDVRSKESSEAPHFIIILHRENASCVGGIGVV
jgi:hypothetical protein